MKLKTKELVICSIFASLTAILTQISIPLPAVPLTMQVFAVALCGLVLGKRLGFISQIIYVLLGTIGLPVFAQFSGGYNIRSYRWIYIIISNNSIYSRLFF